MIEDPSTKNSYLRFFSVNKTFVRFFIVGGFCGLTDLVLLYLFTNYLDIWYLYSGIASFFIVSVISFFLNKKITFKDDNVNKTSQYIKYTVVILVGMIINNSFLFVFTDILKVWYILSRVFSSLIALSWNYSASKRFIFLNKN
jgi:putative flippase GtrA